MNQWDQSIREIDNAIDILKPLQSSAQLQDCYYFKGLCMEKQGNLPEAEASYRESVRLFETLREGAAGGEEEKLSFEESKADVYQRLINVLLRQGKVPEAMSYLERSRLKKFRDQLDVLKPTLSSKEEELARQQEEKLMEEIGKAQEVLHRELSRPREQQDAVRIGALEKRLGERKQEYVEYVNDLRQKCPQLSAVLSIQPDSLIDLQALLPPQAAIVQYLLLSDRLYIFVVSGKEFHYKEVKVDQESVEGKVDTLRSLLMNPQVPANLGPLEAASLRPQDKSRTDLFDAWIQPFMKVSEELRQLLVMPVEAEIAPFSVLGIIPNGKLHLLPFQALGKRLPEGRFQFLIEEKALFQLNSQSILKFAQKRATEIGAKGRLVAFGNPDNSLRHAEEEIRILQGVFSEAKTYLRQEASKENLKKGLDDRDILHMATHGKMKADIKQSYVLMAASPNGKDDGKLFLREIWGLPLKGFQLVTLSACETALGKESSGDTMVSLETAFLMAGTATIVASLWGVDDQATGLLMKRFYENLRTNGKADSLRAAQVALRNDPQFAFPFYWAPFILVGDWR
jgi:CHAT domain-containing protein